MTRPFDVQRVVKGRTESLPQHSHDEGQLTFAASGMVQMRTGEGVWLVPPQLAAWVPPGVSHALDLLTEAELWMVHVPPETIRAWGIEALEARPFALRMTPLLRSLLSELVSIDGNTPKAELIARLMLHELVAMPDAPTFLPLPLGPAARRIAGLILADERGELSLSELASRAAISVRTATRLFPAETGMTLKAWKQRSRIIRAMERLAHGHTPARVAQDTGFSSTAAFSHAFRQVTATTPTTFAGRVSQPYARDEAGRTNGRALDQTLVQARTTDPGSNGASSSGPGGSEGR